VRTWWTICRTAAAALSTHGVDVGRAEADLELLVRRRWPLARRRALAAKISGGWIDSRCRRDPGAAARKTAGDARSACGAYRRFQKKAAVPLSRRAVHSVHATRSASTERSARIFDVAALARLTSTAYVRKASASPRCRCAYLTRCATREVRRVLIYREIFLIGPRRRRASRRAGAAPIVFDFDDAIFLRA